MPGARRLRRGFSGGLVVLLAALAALAGCAKPPPVPVDQFYRLPSPGSAAALPNEPWGAAVYVRALRAYGLHTERAILFSEDAHAVSLERYHYRHWIAGPPESTEMLVKLRHSEHFYRGTITGDRHGEMTVTLDAPDAGVAPGQFTVFYDDEYCWGAARIAG